MKKLIALLMALAMTPAIAAELTLDQSELDAIAAQVPAGEPGPQGPQGPAGADGTVITFDNGVCSAGAYEWPCSEVGTEPPPPPPPADPQCADGIDNDGDNETDFPEDDGCVSLSDDDETDPVTPPPPPPPPSGDWPVEVPVPPSADGLPACGPLVDWPDNPEKFKVLSDSNCVSSGESIVGKSLRITGSNVHVVGLVIDGQGNDKNGVNVSGSNVVIRDAVVGRFLGNDKHCYTVSGGGRDVWIIDSVGYYCSGDGFQAGHQASANPPTNIYLVHNTFFSNRENAIDLKYVNNFIGAENVGYDHRRAPSDTSWCLPDSPSQCSQQNSGSDGTGVVIGSDGGPTGWAFYRNEMYNSDACFRVEESNSTGIISGNVCRDITGSALQLDKNSGRIDFSDNTITNTGRGIFQNWRVNFELDVAGNLFQNISGPTIEYEDGGVCNASTLTDNRFVNTGSVICNNTVANDTDSVNALPGASGNVVE